MSNFEQLPDGAWVPADPYGEHSCWRSLPNAADMPDGALTRCRKCQRWWRAVPDHGPFPMSKWVPVRWWQYRLRRSIASIEAGERWTGHERPVDVPADWDPPSAALVLDKPETDETR